MNTTQLINKESILDFLTGETFQEYTRNLIEDYGDKENYIVDFAKDILKAIINIINTEKVIEINGDTSDGYHTFNELYHHRAVLFSIIVKAFSDKAWKSLRHHDGTMYDGMFIVGIDTPEGQATYHYDIDPYWNMFECRELERAPEWDGHTPAQAIERIRKLEPVRHGRWLKLAYDPAWTKCSECRCNWEWGIVENCNMIYCPNCGAKMGSVALDYAKELIIGGTTK